MIGAEVKHIGQRTLRMLALERLDEVVNETVVEVFATQVSAIRGGLELRLEETLLNGEERNIESCSAEVEDEDV